MFGWWKNKRDLSGRTTPKADAQQMPTVRFDPACITDALKADLMNNIASIDDVPAHDADMIYDAALRSISAGRALDILFQALMRIHGMGKRRAEEIARLLNNRATALIQADEQQRIGIKHAVWMYSGSPCGDADQDAAHKAANGKRYLVAEGMLIDGRWTQPGREDGCRCTSRSVIAGFR